MLYPLPFPTKAPRDQRLTITRKQSATESTFTFATQVVHAASQWQLEWAWPAMRHVTAEAVSAWLDSLNGQVGTFTYYPYQSSYSALSGRSLAGTASPYATTLVATGWAGGAATTLRAGQYFQLGAQLLKIVTANATADANGQVTINFQPELRSTFNVGTGINFANPCGIFRLNSSDGAGFTLTPDRKPELGTYQAREVI
jgi:hypothetical protein